MKISFMVDEKGVLQIMDDVPETEQPSLCENCRRYSSNQEKNCKENEFASVLAMNNHPIILTCTMFEKGESQ